MNDFKIGLIGKGVVGSALYDSFTKRGQPVIVYDNQSDYRDFNVLLDADIVFMCLPTPFVEGHGYDLEPILSNMKELKKGKFNGVVVIKSTVEPGTCHMLEEKFGFTVIHNPEFLSSRTAYQDFDNQRHIVIGYNKNYTTRKGYEIFITAPDIVIRLYKKL